MTSSPITRAGVGLRSDRGPVLGAVMLSVGLVAIDTTILATAVPSIVADLGGFTQFPWLFSAYLLTQAVTTPIYGKLADTYGRKPMMLFGIGLFLVGSVLCALAWSMTALIVARAVQGVGAGAIQPTGMTIMGDIYSVAERAVAQGYIASVWAISAVVGPALGGLFSDHLTWRWIFWINLPLGVVAAVALVRRFEEPAQHYRRRVDWWGAATLAGAAGLLLLGLLEGGIRWPWASTISIGIFAGVVVLLVVFGAVERRAVDPVLPLWVFRNRVLNAATVASFVAGMLMLGVTSYVPTYAQRVLGSDATVAGFAVAALAIGWPIAAATSGRFYMRWGFRPCLLAGSVFALAGTLVIVGVGPDSSVWQLALGCGLMGFGLGYVVSPSVVAMQSAVVRRNRGVATGANMFARSVGSAVGVAVFGAIANAAVVARTGRSAGDVELEILSAGVLHPALHTVFVTVAACSAALVLAGLLMPRTVESPEDPAPD